MSCNRGLSRNGAPLTLQAVKVIGLFYVGPVVGTGLLYVMVGLLLIVGSSTQAETGFDGIVLASAGAITLIVWSVIAGIGLGLYWAMSARSVAAWLVSLGLLSIGMWFDLSLAIANPWWIGLNPNSASSLSLPDPLRMDSLRSLAVATSPDVHAALTIGLVILLLWPSTVVWFLSRKPGAKGVGTQTK